MCVCSVQKWILFVHAQLNKGERVKECRIYEVRDKYTKCLYDRIDGGMFFIWRMFEEEVCAYVGHVCLKWRRC